MRIDVPAETAAVFSNDGRVFFDLDRLIIETAAYIEYCRLNALPESPERIQGMEIVLFMLTNSNEVLKLEDMTGISPVDNTDD
jgi:hypothetical protein